MTDRASNATTAALHGDDLLHQLQKGWRPLPGKTLLALAIGGLRVRLMRSVVTMLSVVLAIAFLTYTGLNNYLTYNLAQAAQEMLVFQPVDQGEVAVAAAALRPIDLFSSMPLDQQRALASELGFDDTRNDEVALITLPELLAKARDELKTAQEELAKVEKDEKALPVDRESARVRVRDAQKQVETLQARRDELTGNVAFGKWVKTGTPAGDAEMSARLTKTLISRYQTLVDTIPTPGRLSEEDWKQLERMLALAGKDPAAAAAIPTVSAALEQERAKRSATELRKLLQHAGVNVQKTLTGNPNDAWLIAMAMLTCAVGIANAMLMSVTERFREIGTMKCLGAQDNLVVKLFLLESAFLGVIGAAVGIVLGIAVVVLASVLQYSGYGLSYFPSLGQSLRIVGYAIAGGVVLAVLGATGPAWQAARMRPVDALRVDE